MIRTEEPMLFQSILISTNFFESKTLISHIAKYPKRVENAAACIPKNGIKRRSSPILTAAPTTEVVKAPFVFLMLYNSFQKNSKMLERQSPTTT